MTTEFRETEHYSRDWFELFQTRIEDTLVLPGLYM